MREGFETAAGLLPMELRKELEKLGGGVREQAEEIRLRSGREPALLLPEGERGFAPWHRVEPGELMRVLDRASGCSLHSVQDELRRGFITAAGGVRIGICGTGVGAGGREGIRDISSLAIRIPRQVEGVGEKAINALRPFTQSVLILSPPGGGKTTFLRELIRLSSAAGRRVAVCDERGEIAGMWQGRAQFDLGPGADILTGVDKAEGVMMLLRAMNPQIIAIDELSAPEDAEAAEKAANCGSVIFATAHAAGVEQMKRRRVYARLLETGIFEKAVVISGTGKGRRYTVEEL